VNMAESAAGKPLPRIFVISDVHIGAGELDDFVPRLQDILLAFLGVLARLPQAVELVINGDFFDFATAAPWGDPQLESRSAHGLRLCFTEAQSCRKLENIIKSHGPVFDALARLLLASPRHRITMLPGNHDADLFWPKVRQRLLDRLAEGPVNSRSALNGQFTFILERQYVVERSGARYWIEHGHQHDRPNSFFPGGNERWSATAPPIFCDILGHWRLYECPGTLGLVRHINHWRPTYHSISYIKPYSRVLRALIAHNSFSEPGRPLMVLRHLVAMLGWDVDLKTALGAEDDATRACHEAVETLLQNLTPQEEQDFAAFLGERGLVVTAPLAHYAKTEMRRDEIINCIASEVLVDEGNAGSQMSRDTLCFIRDGFIKDVETRALVHMAQELIKKRIADYVLTGHTHDPCQMLGKRFSNGGCWIPNQTVESTQDASKIIFEHGSVRFRMNYLEIGRAGAPVLRTFCRGSIDT